MRNGLSWVACILGVSTACFAQSDSASLQIESHLNQVIKTALVEQFSAFENLQIKIRIAPAAQNLEPCIRPLYTDPKDGLLLGTESWWVECPSQWKVKASSVSRLDTQIVTVTRTLKKGDRLQPEDVVLSVATLSGKGVVYRDRQHVVGAKLRRPVRENQVITSAHLEQNFVVLQGHSVNLRYQTRGFVLETTVVAESNGMMGDTIQVRNLDSGRLLSVKVIGEGEVEQF